MDPLAAGSIATTVARMHEIANDALLRSNENANRLSAMMGVRAAQANPIEASSISTLNNASGANNTALSALIMALMNQAHGTPNPYTFTPQAATPAAQNK